MISPFNVLRCLALCVVALAASAVESPASATIPVAGVATGTQDELSEIVIVAPEPRYVAPTSRDRIGRVWVPVLINEQGPFRLVLDSGATRSAVIAQVATTLDVRLDQTPPVMLRGVTGSAVVQTIPVQSLTVGDLLVGRSNLPIVPDAFGGAEGLLGTEGLSDKRIYIDFRNDFINVSRSQNRRAEEGFVTVPFLKDELKLLVVRARVANMTVRAIIDTGAQASIGNGALKVALESRIARSVRSNDEITGATGEMQRGIGAQISPISIGDIQIHDPHITFGDMRIFEHWKLGNEPAIVIGMDVIGLFDTLIIDYKRQELQIRPRGDSRSKNAGLIPRFNP